MSGVVSRAGSRVVVLGGAGGMARHALPLLAAHPAVTELVVADLDGAAAARAVQRLGAPVARPTAVDVTDPAALAAAVAGARLVVNLTGPYYRFGVPVLRAALEAGADHVDICDDWQPTVAMLDLDDLARRRGATAVLGAGASPGVSNLLAALVVAELDEVDRLVTGWDVDVTEEDRSGPRPSAAAVHWVHQVSWPIRTWRAGAAVEELPLREEVLDYPGLGRRSSWTVGHPEAVTLPRTYPGVRESVNVMVNLRAPALEALDATARAVRAGADERTAALALVERLEALGPAGERELPSLFVHATGRAGGRAAVVAARWTAHPPGAMGGATGVPLGIVAGLLLDGTVRAPGVHAPEAVVPPGPFFTALAPHCGVPAGDVVEIVRTVQERPA